jgi:hypothetical protein
MARPISQTVVGAVNGSPIVLDYMKTPFQVSIGCVVVSGSVSYKLQYTYDDPFPSTGVGLSDSSNWTDSTIMTGKTAASDTVLNGAPVSAIRIVNAGTGTVGVRVYQAG